MNDTELALALSVRRWADDLHRFLADHGGARVRVTAMGPEDLLTEAYDVLLIDDICSFLTPRLVHVVRSSGRQVVGVYDPAEFPEGKDRLLECGVSDVVEADAHPDEFVRIVNRAAEMIVTITANANVFSPAESDPEQASETPGQSLVVGGPSGGSGATEVAIGIADRLARWEKSVVLLDADDHAPSLAQRLGLPLYPNIRTALDVMEQRTSSVESVVQPAGSFGVLCGLPNITDWAEVRPMGVVDLVDELRLVFDHVVINIGSQIEGFGQGDFGERYGISRSVLRSADRVVAVGLGLPVGITRLLEWVSIASRIRDARPVDVLINRAPRDQFRRGELIEEFTRSYQPASFGFLPEDPAVAQAAWEGDVIDKGKFRKALDPWVDRFVPEVER